MSFSEKMRDSLGAEGAKVEVEPPSEPVTAGGSAHAKVRVTGGAAPAQLESVVVRVIEARRHWVESGGRNVSEEDAQVLPDRAHLMPAWTRRTVSETKVPIGGTLASAEVRELEVQAPVPEDCGRTSPAIVITINVQADVPGQIDPTGNGRLTVT